MIIIPAIDILDGKCVRLSKGDYTQKIVYHTDPVEVARQLEAEGFRYLHLVDLDGARSNRIINYKILGKIASVTNLSIDFGGGLKRNEDVSIAFEQGATQITGGSIAVSDPTLFIAWLERYGEDRILLGADSNNRKIATNGWIKDTELDVIQYIKDYESMGVRKVIATDIQLDGMLQGPAHNLYRDIRANSGVDLVASGGVSSLADLQELKAIGCQGAIVGKALYEGKISLKEIQELC